MATEQKRMRRPGFAIVENHVLEALGRELGGMGIAVYMGMARFADHQSRCCFPSYQALADVTGLSRRSIIRMVARLCETGFVAKRGRDSGTGDPTSNHYELLYIAPPETVEVVTHSHHPSDSQSLPQCQTVTTLVTHSHHPSDTQSLPPPYRESEQDHVNKTMEQDQLTKPCGGGGRHGPSRRAKPPPPPPVESRSGANGARAPDDVSPWELWEEPGDIPAKLKGVAYMQPFLVGAGLGRRPAKWFEAEIEKYKANRRAMGVPAGRRVWQDLLLWFQKQVAWEAEKEVGRGG